MPQEQVNQIKSKQVASKSRRNPFNGPIPGQSLTRSPGSSKMEQPPKFTSMDDAAEFAFDKITQPRNTAKLLALLKSGMPAETYARTMAMGGAQEGMWTPDIGMLIAPVIQAQAIAVAKKEGLTDEEINISNPRRADAEFFAKLEAPDIPTNPTPGDQEIEKEVPKFNNLFSEGK